MDKKTLSIFVLTFVVVTLAVSSLNASVFGDGIEINITAGNSTNQTMNDSIVNRTIIGKVAYVVKNMNFVDENVELYLDAKNLEIDVITDRNIASTDFDKYDLILIGKGKLQNFKEIPLNANVVLASNYHANYFGFVKQRVSRFAASSPLKVMFYDERVQVYDKSSFKLGGPAIAYYYLTSENINNNVVAVAKAYKGGNHYLGDVVSFIEINNTNSSSTRRCFFGIIESKHWSEDAEILLDDCIDFTLGKFRRNIGIDDSLMNSVNGIAIKDVRSNSYLPNSTAILECDKNYMVYTNVINKGDLSEKVTLIGNLDTMQFGETKLVSTNSSKLFSQNVKTMDVNGNYTLSIRVMNQNNIDIDMSDNSRQRDVRVVC